MSYGLFDPTNLSGWHSAGQVHCETYVSYMIHVQDNSRVLKLCTLEQQTYSDCWLVMQVQIVRGTWGSHA